MELGVVVREQHLPELSTMYEGLDLDGNGQLSLPELKKMLKSLAEAALGNTDVTKKLAKEVAAAKRERRSARAHLNSTSPSPLMPCLLLAETLLFSCFPCPPSLPCLQSQTEGVAKNAQNDFEVELGTAGLQSNKGDYGESDDIVVGAT